MSAGRFFAPRVRARQAGFTYIGILITVAVMSAGMAAFAEVASHAMQREKEAELIFRGNQYLEAIASYHKLEGRYPETLGDLIEHKGMPIRHLRRMYPDPMTGDADWGLVTAPEGGIMGVHSQSTDTPIKTGNFLSKNESFQDAASYADWKFIHSPAGLPPGVEKSAPK
jgi:type II secretory pathway pseudopilin PulG